MPVDLGDLIRLKWTNLSPAGGEVNATTVTLTITLPDNTTATPTVTNPPAVTGKYEFDYQTVQAGRHHARWVGTGTNPGAYVEVFDVRPASLGYLVSMADAKATLNKSATVTTDDEELRGLIEATTEAVEHITGPIVRQTVAERHENCRWLVLRRTPIISLTSMVPILTGGTTYLVADVDVDSPTGIVQRLDGGSFVGPLRVTYVAGRAVVPGAVREAALVILQHLWQTQRGAKGAPKIGGTEVTMMPGLGYALPNRALELLAPYKRAPMVA